MSVPKKIIEVRCEAEGLVPTEHSLYISIRAQRLSHLHNGAIVKEYIISTSKNEPSCATNSYATPVGLHTIADKIGDNEPLGMVFKGRVPIGKLANEMPADEQANRLITTRIMRLRGQEVGLNRGTGCDSYERMIYIHGTNLEHELGTPSSKGCITMANKDIVELFKQVPQGSIVYIDR